MLALSDPTQPMRRAALDASGGFAWWYVDLVNSEGDGLVMIWSFGLPFLPGYRSGTNTGRGVHARTRPSLNLSTWRNGRPDLYLLQEWPEASVDWRDGTELVTFGDETTLQSTVADGRRSLCARLDLPLPGTTERLRGTVEVTGPVVRLPAPTTPDSVHQWSPLTTATPGSARLHVGEELVFALEGRAYHDRNESITPLDQLGIAYWVWGRTPIGEGELIHYILWPQDGGALQAHVWHIDADGDGRAWTVRQVEEGPRRRSLFGMRHHPDLILHTDHGTVHVRTKKLIDNGPFYLRMLTDVDTPAGSGSGVGEAIIPDRVDHPLHRPFVRMRVHNLDGPNSMWLPLFSGPGRGRLRRLLMPAGGRQITAERGPSS
jgi:hypothetical protein